MKHTDMIEILVILSAAYPSFKLDEITIDLWCRKFEQYEYDTVARSVDRYIDTPAEFAPSIGKLKNLVAGNSLHEIHPLALVVRLNRYISRHGGRREEEILPGLPEHVRTIVQKIGWHNLCRWPEEKVEKYFLALYSDTVKTQGLAEYHRPQLMGGQNEF